MQFQKKKLMKYVLKLINFIVMFLNKLGLIKLWSKIKELVSNNVNKREGKPKGIATLDTNGKLPAVQLTSLKTINGESVIGDGNITIDLNIYKVVTSLPITNIDNSKIYLVIDSEGIEGNIYTEYSYINGKWEELGKYKANVDLTPYMTKEKATGLIYDFEFDNNNYPDAVNMDVHVTYYNGNTDSDDIETARTSLIISAATSTTAGVMTSTMFNKLDDIASNATADTAITDDELDAILV